MEETFSGHFTFRHAGLSPADEESKGMLKAQLHQFYNSLLLHGMEPWDEPDNWMDAFFLLEKYLAQVDDGSRQLVFIDELPWLDSPRSGFLRALEGFWNNWGCHRKNLMVVVCGSANAWMLDKLINNHGGLYGRLTYEIKLLPFNLHECEAFLKSREVPFSRYEITQSYMVFGGIPCYLEHIDSKRNLGQNMDRLLFARGGVLREEYDRLFDAVFANPEAVKTIVELLHTRNAGYTRKEITEKLDVTDGGTLSKNLNALIASDFVIKYAPFGYSKREEHYKLIDPFCLSYLTFVKDQGVNQETFWRHNMASQQAEDWGDTAFENVCFAHINQIKRALGIAGVITSTSAWSKKEDDEEGRRIDLLIHRNDKVINMCEIKFRGEDVEVDQNYYRVLLSRPERIMERVSPKISICSTLITTFGLKHNEYSGGFTYVVTLNDLFER